MTDPPFAWLEERGVLDGLCAVHAVIRLVHFLYGPISTREASDLLMVLLPHLRTASASSRQVWDGCTPNVMARMLSDVVEVEYPIARTRPFRQQGQLPLDRFWSAMEAFLQGEERVVLMPVGGYYHHWSLVRQVTHDRLLLFDRNPLHSLCRHRCVTASDPPGGEPGLIDLIGRLDADLGERIHHRLYPQHAHFLSLIP